MGKQTKIYWVAEIRTEELGLTRFIIQKETSTFYTYLDVASGLTVYYITSLNKSWYSWFSKMNVINLKSYFYLLNV